MSELPVRPAPIIKLFDGPMWDFINKGELRLQRCTGCGTLRYPPAGCCYKCLSDQYEWSPVSGRGKVKSWTVFYRQYYPELPPPVPVVLVEIEEGPIVVANLVDTDISALRLDLPVELTFQAVRWNNGEEGKIFQWRAAR
jgi:uncharacterized OB-fold protein